MLLHEYHGCRGYIVGVSRPLCDPCMAFAGILSASCRPLCVPSMRSWLWQVSRQRQSTLVQAMGIMLTGTSTAASFESLSELVRGSRLESK
ncbi:hypothetical protein EV363DRAFT_1433534 [Boletus edulis]|nr:hypothetical protein EV363DRAFT_1433534 [Boletus edulis]